MKNTACDQLLANTADPIMGSLLMCTPHTPTHKSTSSVIQTFTGWSGVLSHHHHGTGSSRLASRVPRLSPVLTDSCSQLLSQPRLVGQQVGEVAAGEQVREEEKKSIERGMVTELGEKVVLE